MKIVLFSIGTRGDMEPFLAIADILKRHGHQVICAFPEQFRDLAGEDIQFASLGSKFIEMLDSDVGKAALGGGGSGIKKLMAFIKLARRQNEINKELVFNQFKIIEKEKPDRIVFNGKAMVPCIWSLDHPGKATQVSPVPYLHYVKGHTHVAFNSNFGSQLNKWTFSLANFGLIKTIMISAKWLNIHKGISQKQVRTALSSCPVIYTISPVLFPRPDYWPENRKVLGYHQRSEESQWAPKPELLDFISRHEKLLLVTFGSMTNPQPGEKTRILLEILSRNQIPAIINTASGGLKEPEKYEKALFYFTSKIPYEWVLQRVYGVIHHGGSGTTHLALKHGCPMLIIPHIIDQFVWNKMIYSKGAGPKGLKIGKISTSNLEQKILDLINNDSYKRIAEEIGASIRNEDFQEEIYRSIVGNKE